MNTFTLTKTDEKYPARLRACADAPELLYGIGNLDANRGHLVSIVGTRRATERGREQTAKFVKELASLVPNVTIVSGLAYGIDVAAHKAALDCGISTIIIPAHGLDRIYPAIHRPVAVASLEKGGILTEYPEGTEPDAWRFVQRNRIVAGMSECTVVVESGARGGSLITAKLANQYGRPVFAFPGRASDEQSKGCNALIRDREAMLITSAEDLVTYMGWQTVHEIVDTQQELPDLFSGLGALEQRIMQVLRENEEGVHVNDLVEKLGESYSSVSSSLMMMELDDLVKTLPGGMCKATV